jgi:hypothetical protein
MRIRGIKTRATIGALIDRYNELLRPPQKIHQINSLRYH